VFGDELLTKIIFHKTTFVDLAPIEVEILFVFFFKNKKIGTESGNKPLLKMPKPVASNIIN
jgi:hypothetical protein